MEAGAFILGVVVGLAVIASVEYLCSQTEGGAEW